MSLLAEPGGESAGIVAKGMADADVERLMQWPFANVCSDGQSIGLHPRGFGSFAKVVGPYVRDQKLFPLEEAVRKMSSLAAANVGIANRGRIAPGYFADLVLFDPAASPIARTSERRRRRRFGVRTVWVNGQVVFENGKTTGVYSGRPLRRETPRAQLLTRRSAAFHGETRRARCSRSCSASRLTRERRTSTTGNRGSDP